MPKVVPLFPEERMLSRTAENWEAFRAMLKRQAPEQQALIDYLVDGLIERQASLSDLVLARDIALIITMVLDPEAPLKRPRSRTRI